MIERSSGVLMPMSSLPSPYGIGTMGKEAFRFVDFLAAAAQKYWQLLPLGPTGYGDSPYSSCSCFAGNPYLIDLELLGDHQVRLKVSDAYLAFAEENEISVFVDFHWMTNAFITDYLADLLLENGFSTGYIASRDGFTRNLDNRNQAYSVNIFNRQGEQAYAAGEMIYRSGATLVSLRDYPLSDRDQWSYYRWNDGHLTNTFVDISDGHSKAAVDTLLTYAYGKSCGEVLLEMLDVYIADSLEEGKLNALAKQGMHSVWCQDQVVCYNEAGLEIGSLFEKDDVRYTTRYAGK
jgi:hypothetical protein